MTTSLGLSLTDKFQVIILPRTLHMTNTESKIKDLVSTVRSDQDKLMDSFKSQRNDELGLLNPMQQGKYLLATGD